MQATSNQTLNWLSPTNSLNATTLDLDQWDRLPYANEFHKREHAIEAMLADLQKKRSHEQTDLQLVSADSGWLAGIRRMDWDSKHFEIEMGQIDPLIAPAAELSEKQIAIASDLIRACVDNGFDRGLTHISAFVDTRDSVWHHALQRNGFNLIDTLVTYWLEMKKVTRFENNPHIRICQADDVEEVARISSHCFGTREQNVNRFNADTVFPAHKVKELYALWIRNSFSKQLADETLVYELDGKPVGFVTMEAPSTDSNRRPVGRIPLNAVSAGYQNRGIYGELVKAALNWFADKNCEITEIKTQIPNTGVHIAWGRLGAKLINSSYRFRRSK